MMALARRAALSMIGAVLAPVRVQEPGVPAVVPAEPIPSARPGPDDRLWGCLALLGQMNDEFNKLPEDHPEQTVLIERMDALVSEAAFIRPESDEGYAVKAYIAQVNQHSGMVGQLLISGLLVDLMVRGGMVGRAQA